MELKLSQEEAETLREYLYETVNSKLAFLHEGSNDVIDKDIKKLRAVYYRLLTETEHRPYFSE